MRFWKYQGLGNDFVLVDRLSGGAPIVGSLASRICDRRRGVGADGVLTVLPSSSGVARMHVANADGSIAEMCGNGLRCVVGHLVLERGLAPEMTIETGAGPKSCRVTRHDERAVEVEVDMGAPELEAERIPLRDTTGRFVQGAIPVDGRVLKGTAVSMGNPHLVLFGLPPAVASTLGPILETHRLFPNRTNVEFAAQEGPGLAVTVWERGVGLTEACGTGACAAMVAAVLECRIPAGAERPVRLAGGTLQVRVEPDLSRVFMRGPATRVYRGDFEGGER